MTGRPSSRFNPEPNGANPRKCLHIVETLDRNAVENWLIRMLRHAAHTGTATNWTFYCILDTPGSLDNVASELGAKVVHSPVQIGQTAAFARALRDELIRGEYDIVHAHHDLLNGIYFAASLGTPVSTRICHIHNADESIPTSSRFKRKLLRGPMRRAAIDLASKVVGISDHTLDSFLDGRNRMPGRDVVHYYGVDPAPFHLHETDREEFRRENNIAGDAHVLLFAGRLVPEKNPLFVLEVFRELLRNDPTAVAVFAGAGSEEEHIRARANELGIFDSIRLLGWRTDLPKVMRGSDCFILPRKEHPLEGFGLAVVEAQLAGLTLLLSNGIADDPLLPSAVYRRLPLSAGARKWAEAASDLFRSGPEPLHRVMKDLDESEMNLNRALEGLLRLHS